MSETEPDPLETVYGVGTTIVDCGERATITEVETDDEHVTYTLEFEDGESRRIGGREVELGLIDGTIQVNA